MKYAILTYLPYLLSATTIYGLILAGNKNPRAWLFGLANQFGWLLWIITAQAWGFLPMHIAFWIVYTRNHFKWRRP